MPLKTSCIALAATVILLTGSVTSAAIQNPSPTDEAVARLRAVLLHDTWAHTTPLGPIVIETRVLVFRERDELSEWIYDDTGPVELKGSWHLEPAGDSVVLVLEGEYLRDKGRFTLTHIPKDHAIELRLIGGKEVVRFQIQKKSAR